MVYHIPGNFPCHQISVYLCFIAKIDFIEVDHTSPFLSTWVIAVFCEVFEIAFFVKIW